MTTPRRQMKLTAFCHPPGHWRMPGAAPTDMEFDEVMHLAQVAERGLFDMLFFQDSAAVAPAFYLSDGSAEALAEAARCVRLEPLTMLAALATVTKHLGLISTATTTYNDPFSIARKLATIDHISKGRAGWNLVTSQNVDEAQNFSQDAHMDHALRYERAQEFYDVVTGLWDSWEDDAVIRDRATGRYIEPSKLHVLNHVGKHFKVRGPLNVSRPPQGYPIVAQAGSSEPGRALAARTAEVVFTAQVDLAEARAFYADVKGRMAQHGRDPDHMKIMPGIRYVLGETEAAARAEYDMMVNEASDEGALASVQRLAGDLDIRQFDPDGPLPDLPPSNAARARQQMMIDLARRENLSIRELGRRFTFSLGHMVFIGTPKGLADFMELWFNEGAADGFTLLSPYYPRPLERFVEHVIPELQRRGLFRTAYEGSTLRENLGIPFRANRHADIGKTGGLAAMTERFPA
jgi:FMN-dependent oxidoreductase (nitrilotriacetate monooxygenase family)